MFASQSAFDAAARQPFLDQPAKKKLSSRWSLSFASSSAPSLSSANKRLSDHTAGTVPDYESDDSSSSSSLSENDQDYEAPNLDHTCVDDDDDKEEEIVVFEEVDDFHVQNIELRPMSISFDVAVLQERAVEFGVVRDSMQQINDIQKDLAALVHSQEEDIENMASLSIEALGQTQVGLAHLLRLQEAERNTEQRRRMLSIFFWIVVFGAYWVLSGTVLDGVSEGNGLPLDP